MVSASELENAITAADAAVREGRAIAVENTSLASRLRCAEEQVRASCPDYILTLRCFVNVLTSNKVRLVGGPIRGDPGTT